MKEKIGKKKKKRVFISKGSPLLVLLNPEKVKALGAG